MGDAAHAESFRHEVFNKPFTIRPRTEDRPTPDNYRRFPEGDRLPETMKVWLVQRTDRTYGGVVARAYGFADSPDAEILVKGFNQGKEYGAAAVSRHGNFLQWGYSASPSQMTRPGRRLFLNSIVYISRFNGKRPLIRVRADDRTNALRLAGVITRISGDKREFFERTFAAELWDRYSRDPEGLTRLYRENIEWVYYDKVFRIDEQLKSLGLESNRRPEVLDALVAMLADPTRARLARDLLARYTAGTFDTAEQWQAWLAASRPRLYFTDVGGYKFLVAPEGYELD